ncbi:hypothetical protein [Aphanothece hegewaldii]|uniref:hypothetical protein n=1 Tax=Aphanothece hegewaldii TaxID=1521625 RepID=UPI001FE488EA|nr:hypothetical protein [Aphanothece hegewaldii]
MSHPSKIQQTLDIAGQVGVVRAKELEKQGIHRESLFSSGATRTPDPLRTGDLHFS